MTISITNENLLNDVLKEQLNCYESNFILTINKNVTTFTDYFNRDNTNVNKLLIFMFYDQLKKLQFCLYAELIKIEEDERCIFTLYSEISKKIIKQPDEVCWDCPELKQFLEGLKTEYEENNVINNDGKLLAEIIETVFTLKKQKEDENNGR